MNYWSWENSMYSATISQLKLKAEEKTRGNAIYFLAGILYIYAAQKRIQVF